MNDRAERVLEFATFLGVVGGLALTVCSFLLPEARGLGVTGLAILLPGLIYGLR
jgi:hypothetical protein